MEKNDFIFWTGIMADHAEFLASAFTFQEDAFIQEANRFQTIFTRHHTNTQSQTADTHYQNTIKSDLIKFIEFKKMIITGLLGCDILIHFPPSFINHMVNEAMEFLSLINSDSCPEKAQTPATYIKIWIADASGHASAIIASLDAAETLILENANYYKKEFDYIYKKSVELEMIQDNVGVGNYFGLLKSEATQTLRQFIGFCTELVELLDNCNLKSIGTFSAAMVHHFIREHEYVIGKLKTCVR